MQLVFWFDSWVISATKGIMGQQYDNLSHSLVVQGNFPKRYVWDILVECRGNRNIIPLFEKRGALFAPLTADQLALEGYYAFQLRGACGKMIRHTNVVQVYVPSTIVGPGTWPVLPTEFSQAEENIRELNAHPPIPGPKGFWLLWDLESKSYVESSLPLPDTGSGGGLPIRALDKTLNLSQDGTLSVNTAKEVEQDNTLPITSAAVFETVGNIEILLETI